MVSLYINLFKTARPRQWLKNFAVAAPLLFSGNFFIWREFLLVLWAFIIFSALSSAIYIINDIVDRDKDLQHPFKRNRPIASGALNPIVAFAFACLLVTFGVAASLQFRPAFQVAIGVFLVLQVTYSLLLKRLMLLDVMTIAASFVVRVYAGAFIIGAHVNVWFLLAVISLSLFLAIGKRRSELTIMQNQERASQTRATLLHYPETLLDILTTMFATAAWLTYALFTFNFPTPRITEVVAIFFADYLPSTLEQAKWLMLTVPFVIYGVMRYLYVVYEKKEGESPERILLSDLPMLITVVLWGIAVLGILYGFNFTFV